MIETIGDKNTLVWGILITKSILLLGNSSDEITKVLAPREITSWILLIVFSTKFSSVITLITVTSFSINAIGPCFNSPAAYASECIYEISFNFNEASNAVL